MNNQLHQNEENSFNLKTENEILKIKLAAELGCNFISSPSNASPEVVNSFLKNIYKFHTSEHKEITFHELIGSPEIKRFDEQEREKVFKEFKKLLELFSKKEIIFDPHGISGIYNKYNFFIDKILPQLCNYMPLPEMVMIYPFLDFAPEEWMEMYDTAIKYLQEALFEIEKGNYHPFSDIIQGFISDNSPFSQFEDFAGKITELKLDKIEIIQVNVKEGVSEFFCTSSIRGMYGKRMMYFEGSLLFEMLAIEKEPCSFEVIKCYEANC